MISSVGAVLAVASLALCSGESTMSTGPDDPEEPGPGPGDPDVAVEPSRATATVGDTVAFEIVGVDDTTDVTVTWESTDTTVAVVDDEGVAEVVGDGEALIAAEVETGEATERDTAELLASPVPDLLENFATYGSTSDMLSDPRGIYRSAEDITEGQITLDTSEGLDVAGHDLSQSMRYRFDGDQKTISRGLDLPGSGVNELWIEAWVKFSTNFKTNWGDPNANPDYKLIFAVTDPSRFQLKTGTFGGSYDVTPPNGTHFRDQSSQQDWNGEWHRYRLHFEHESSDGACDGTVTAEVDGQRFFGSEGDVCTNRGFGQMFFVALGRNMNHGESVSEDIFVWWGRVALWHSQAPGW